MPILKTGYRVLTYNRIVIYHNINMNLFLFLVPEPQVVQETPIFFINICLIFGALILIYAFRPRSLQQLSSDVIKRRSNEPVSILLIFLLLVELKYTTIYIFITQTYLCL